MTCTVPAVSPAAVAPVANCKTGVAAEAVICCAADGAAWACPTLSDAATANRLRCANFRSR